MKIIKNTYHPTSISHFLPIYLNFDFQFFSLFFSPHSYFLLVHNNTVKITWKIFYRTTTQQVCGNGRGSVAQHCRLLLLSRLSLQCANISILMRRESPAVMKQSSLVINLSEWSLWSLHFLSHTKNVVLNNLSRREIKLMMANKKTVDNLKLINEIIYSKQIPFTGEIPHRTFD